MSSARALPTVHVSGWGFFAPDYAGAAEALANQRRPERAVPAFALVEGRARRFTSLVTQMHLEVCGQALAASGVPGHDVYTVFASELGETSTTLELLRGMTDQGVASAARFAQSVHSTPSGIYSIATQNRLPSQAIAAGVHTFEAAWLESGLIAHETGAPVLLSIADDATPELLGSQRAGAALAASFLIRARGPGRPVSVLPTAPEAPHLGQSAIVRAVALLLELAP